MSFDYLNAAFQSNVKPSAKKFVLVALANYANKKGIAYPTAESLSNKTGQNIKTVVKHLSNLSSENIITDTGKRVGKTGSVIKYQINLEALPKTDELRSPKNGTATDESSPKNGLAKPSEAHPKTDKSSPKNGTAKLTQNRVTEPSVLLTFNEPSVKRPSFPLEQQKEVIEYLNLKSGKNFALIETNTAFVKARLKEGYSLADLRSVIDHKCQEWKDDSKMNSYLRPATLFNKTKFSQYHGNIGSASGTGSIAGLSASEMANAI